MPHGARVSNFQFTQSEIYKNRLNSYSFILRTVFLQVKLHDKLIVRKQRVHRRIPSHHVVIYTKIMPPPNAHLLGRHKGQTHMPITNYVNRIENNGPNGAGLTLWPAMNPDDLVSGNPVQHGHLYDEDEPTDYSVGVWDCTAFVDKPASYPVDEFMLLLDGHVDMIMPDDTKITVNAGEAFIIPKGLKCQWVMPGTVRKIFMILDGDTPGDADNSTLHRITVPPLDAITPTPSGALSTRVTHFVNHDDRMRVCTDTYAEKQQGPAPQIGRHLIHVMQGSVTFADQPNGSFVQGDSFYLLPGNDLAWAIAANTRLLVTTCDLPTTTHTI
jgi:uncharacterized cupin superfamily protein